MSLKEDVIVALVSFLVVSPMLLVPIYNYYQYSRFLNAKVAEETSLTVVSIDKVEIRARDVTKLITAYDNRKKPIYLVIVKEDRVLEVSENVARIISGYLSGRCEGASKLF